MLKISETEVDVENYAKHALSKRLLGI